MSSILYLSQMPIKLKKKFPRPQKFSPMWYFPQTFQQTFIFSCTTCLAELYFLLIKGLFSRYFFKDSVFSINYSLSFEIEYHE